MSNKDGPFFRRYVSLLAFREAQIAYANRLFLATVLLSSACIEGEITTFLYNEKVATWKEVAKMDFHTLIERAHKEKIISSEECGELNELRRIRNSIAHAQESPAEEFELVLFGADPLTGKIRKGVRLEKEAERAFEILGNFVLKHCYPPLSKNDQKKIGLTS